jgi:hypothetical protein
MIMIGRRDWGGIWQSNDWNGGEVNGTVERNDTAG